MLLSYTPLHWMSKNDLLLRGCPLIVRASVIPIQDEISRNVSDHVRTDSRIGQDNTEDDLDDNDDDDGGDDDVDEDSVEYDE